ncbi:hypothetical protein JDV02_004829 [Purpureocillium takamizusanense]|uniref:Uncharacterized protein n=1 Tax=Purpureocillium takamizusanense TaxID=2060973 RepID=A0A9Q8QGP4_9HYPO|nr:uncharacterized protein JDV02_004829 [Purpureocillium takamizusanense]UNI18569.1 hypothetical protein JDV02_004829 [Purpureocillium takamizusanense]
MALRMFCKGFVRGLTHGQSSEEWPHCPVVCCDTLKKMVSTGRASAIRCWIDGGMLGLIGPGGKADLTKFSSHSEGYVQVNLMLTDKFLSFEKTTGIEFVWNCQDASKTPFGKLPETTGMTVFGLARAAMLVLEPEHGCSRADMPNCEFCGGQTQPCREFLYDAYKKAFEGFLKLDVVVQANFGLFSEEQQAAYSVAISLVTLRVMAVHLGMDSSANELSAILNSWLPILAKAW